MINLRQLAQGGAAARAAGFEGHWHAVDFQPDLTAPQRFTIGVALSQKGKLTHFRIAEEAPKLKCFYAQRFSKAVWQWLRSELVAELTESTQGRATAIGKFVSASPQIHIGPGFYASATSADSALSSCFERIVSVVARDKKNHSKGIPQEALRIDVARLLKQKMNTQFEQVFQGEHGMQITHANLVHTFDIGYDDHKTAASVVSGSYAGLDTAQLNVMTAINDLHTFSHIRKRDQIGLAVLTPTVELLPAETVKTWQDWWSHFSYKLRESDLVLLAEADNTADLADQVLDWYKDPA